MHAASAEGDVLRIALITEVYHDHQGGERLCERLLEARRAGAELAVLPELPLNAWCAASETPSDDDAEGPDGPRQRLQSGAAREVGIALLGGAIVRDPATGRRHNTAVLYDGSGAPLTRYRKVHLPEEEGYWETRHFEPGDALPEVVDVFGFPVAIQVCSDVNRPEPTHIVAAMGALAVLSPRATPHETYARWRYVMRASAVTSTLYVLSVNRPGGEPGTLNGGPTLAVAPDGEVLVENDNPLTVLTLSRRAVDVARQRYPGYLPVRSDLYAEGWSRVAGRPGAASVGRRQGSPFD